MISNQLYLLEGKSMLRRQLGNQLGYDYKLCVFQEIDLLLKQMESQLPDLVICLHDLPKSNGLLLVETIRSLTPFKHIPILVLMSNPVFQDRLLALTHGADGVIELESYQQILPVVVAGVLKNRQAWTNHTQRLLLLPDHYRELPSEDEFFLNKLNNFIKAHLSDLNLNVHKLAFAVSMSVSQLDRRMQRLVGHSPKTYIRELRLQVARQLLSEKRGNVSEVASLTGFKSVSYFSIRFQERFGVKASELRNMKVIWSEQVA